MAWDTWDKELCFFSEALLVFSRVAIVITILAEKESFQMETEAEEGERESNLSIHSVSF